MKISTEIGSAARCLGTRKAIEVYSEIGFDGWDLSLSPIGRMQSQPDHPLNRPEYLKYASELGHIGRECGMVCNQSHAPLFRQLTKDFLPNVKRAIECTAAAECNICVVHPNTLYSPEQNAELFAELLDFAKPYGVKIAMENICIWEKETNFGIPGASSTSESLSAHLAAVNNDNLVICLDIGHAEISSLGTSATDIINKLGGKIQALHIHDNDKIYDKHQIPFSGKIDYLPILRALKRTGYSGYFTLEAGLHLSKLTEDNIIVGMKDLACAVKHLADMYEEI